jgi:Transposase, Mutator family
LIAAIRNKAVCVALGGTPEGTKDILGLWIETSEGAKVLAARHAPGGIISLQGAASSRNPWARLSRYRRAASSESARGRLEAETSFADDPPPATPAK